MSTLHQLKEGLNEAWDNLMEGWQRLYRHAASALTRFTPGAKEHVGDGTDVAVRSSGWGLLAAEVFDNRDQVVVRLEAPGLNKGDLDLQVRDGYLVVRGEKHVERESSQGRYHVTECAYGRFERAVPLPEEVDSGKARAHYENGVLRVELPKARSHRRKFKVTVN